MLEIIKEYTRNDFFFQYGKCNLNSGEKLWTSQVKNWKIPNYEVFFDIDPNNRFGDNKDYYEVTLNKDVQLLNIFSCAKRGSSILSDWYINNDSSMVYFKQNYKTRNDVITLLKQKGIDGWIGAVEVSPMLCEICIFSPLDTLSSKIKLETDISFILDDKVNASFGRNITELNCMQKRMQDIIAEDSEIWTPYDYYFL